MQYVNIISVLNNTKSHEKGAVTLPNELFRILLMGALREKNVFDESFYLEFYSDIKDAINRHSVTSAADHYYTTGYFEGRQPKKFLVDERFYLEHNPDVANAVRSGSVSSAQEHFEQAGFREGRQPYAGFSLF